MRCSVDMKIHHLNCGTMCPAGAKHDFICHCLLIEAASSLILIDTGWGNNDMKNPARFGLTSKFLGLRSRPWETAHAQIQKLSYIPDDLTDIVVTHLDTDHGGGIADFPAARVHVSARELDSTKTSKEWLARLRYRHLETGKNPRWTAHAPELGEPWNGFASVKEIKGLPPEILLVDLPGHTAGHLGVAIRNEGGWLLHAGDAYYARENFFGLRFFERMVHRDHKTAMKTKKRLSELRRDSNVRIFCSHDASEMEGIKEA